MICYNDTTYCISPSCKNECGCKLTEEIRRDAQKWWDDILKENPLYSFQKGAPIAMSYFCGGEND